MTWRELKNLINKQARKNKQFLDTEINLYDFNDGSEHCVDTTELLLNHEENDIDNDSNWVMYLSINHEESNNENQAAETGID